MKKKIEQMALSITRYKLVSFLLPHYALVSTHERCCPDAHCNMNLWHRGWSLEGEQAMLLTHVSDISLDDTGV